MDNDFESVSLSDSDKKAIVFTEIDGNPIDNIDPAINQRLPLIWETFLHTVYYPFFLTHAKALDIINAEKKHTPPNITPKNIELLCQKNSAFNNAIHFFISEAEKNIDLVNTYNIFTILKVKKDQPITSLNTIPLSLKRYCMHYALQKKNPIDDPNRTLSQKEQKNLHKLYLCGKIIEKISDEEINHKLRPLLPKFKFTQEETNIFEAKIENNKQNRIDKNILYSMNT
jgi:hypothetical protein